MTAYKDKDSLLVVCACDSLEHQIRFYKDNHFVTIEYHLYVQESVWGRIKQAVRHIFGYRAKFGNFGDTYLAAEEATAIRDYLDVWIQNVST